MGILRYEISNYARPGSESLHNMKYWKLEPYAGFGADAHSFDGTVRWQNVETAREYVQRWRSGETPRVEVTRPNPVEEKFFVGLRLGLIFAMINIVGVEFLINFGGLGQLINELAERYDLPGTYGAILFVILVSIVFFDLTERAERMMRRTE